jgi:outer membrane protein OmpA-like peptidoglycan-associated protein
MMKKVIIYVMSAIVLMTACKMNKTQKGAVIGTGTGAVVGGIIGKASGNTALGAIIGATVGGASGAVIGNQMDKQAEEIEQKIPDAKVERLGEGIIVEFSDKVLFEHDMSQLSSSSKRSLDKLVTVLNAYPDTDIEVQGHTDSDGSDSYNQELSERRASSVSSYLSGNGIASSRLNTQGFGEGAPGYENSTDEGKAMNRRVNFLITANEKMKAEAKNQAGE